ncbi:MAG: hypothetical protein FJX77_04675 [Armatimonadetes bacterium]|nr:hypothetical protein [Armatimonadota bacterium]
MDATGREICHPAGHTGPVRSLVRRGDGRQLAGGSADGTMRVGDGKTGACVWVLVPLAQGWACYTPEERCACGGDPTGF